MRDKGTTPKTHKLNLWCGKDAIRQEISPPYTEAYSGDHRPTEGTQIYADDIVREGWGINWTALSQRKLEQKK